MHAVGATLGLSSSWQEAWAWFAATYPTVKYPLAIAGVAAGLLIFWRTVIYVDGDSQSVGGYNLSGEGQGARRTRAEQLGRQPGGEGRPAKEAAEAAVRGTALLGRYGGAAFDRIVRRRRKDAAPSPDVTNPAQRENVTDVAHDEKRTYRNTMSSQSASTPAQLGAIVRGARQAADITQAELANRAGVSRRWLIALENGDGNGAEFGKILSTLAALGLRLAVHTEPPEMSDAERELAELYAQDDR